MYLFLGSKFSVDDGNYPAKGIDLVSGDDGVVERGGRMDPRSYRLRCGW